MSTGLLFTCREITDQLTEYQEGTLAPLARLRVRLHLALCKGCQHFMDSLQALPGLVTTSPQDEDTATALAVLARAKARLGRPRPPRIPAPLAAELAAGGNEILRLQSIAQLALVEGRKPTQAPFLPQEVLDQLPAPATWKWWSLGLRGARMTKLMSSPDGQQDLILISMPGGRHFPPHRHLGQESLMVLQGGLDDGLGVAEPGEWRHYPKGHPEHAPLSTPEGCWALIRVDAGSVRFSGWRGLVQGWLE